MKKLLFGVVLTALLAAVVLSVDEGWAERPTGSQVSGYALHTSTIDSTSAVQRDTTTAPTGTLTKLAWNTDVANYSSVTGYVWSEYVTLDTGTGGVVPDTTQDTVIYVIYTADYDGTPYKEVWRDTAVAFHVTASVANGDYIDFDVSDSGLWDVTYLAVITSLQDSTYTKARLAADIHWKSGWKFWNK